MHQQSVPGLTALALLLIFDTHISFAQPQHQHEPLKETRSSTSIRQVLFTVNNKNRIEKSIDLKKGETVQLIIKGGQEGIYHLHGYNLMATLNHAQQLSITFQANHAGRYPLVFHRDDPLLGEQELTVAHIEVKSH